MGKNASIDVVAHDKTQAALDSAANGMERLKIRAGAMSGGMSLASGAAVVAVAAFAKSCIDKYEQVGSETIKLSRLTGGTAEDMSALRVQAQASGVPFENLAKSITIFAKGLETGKPAKALEELGVASKDASGNTRGFQDMLGDLAEKFQGMPNSLDKTRLATELFGRSGADMEPLLNKGRDGLANITQQAKDMGLVLNGDSLQAMKDHAQAQRDMGIAIDGMKMKIGEALMPVMETAVGAVTTLAGGFAKMPEPMQQIAVGAIGVFGGLTLINRVAGFVGGSVSKMADTFNNLRGRLSESEGGLTRLGTVAAGVGGALLILGGMQMGGELVNSINDQKGKLDQALKELQALSSASSDDIIRSFSKLAGAQSGGFFKDAVESFGKNIKLLPDISDETIEDIQRSFDQLDLSRQSQVLDAFKDRLTRLKPGTQEYADIQNVIDNLTGRYDINTNAAKNNATATQGVADATTAAMQSYQTYTEELKKSTDPLYAVLDGNTKLKESQDKATFAGITLMDAVKKFGPNSQEALQAQKDLNAAQDGAVVSAQNYDGALANLSSKLDDGSISIEDAKGALQRWVAQGWITQDQADRVALHFDLAGAAAHNAAGDYVMRITLQDLASNGLKTLAGRVLQFFGTPSNLPAGTAGPTKKTARGGHLFAGDVSWVGENGPELFHADRSGTIVPSSSGDGGGSSVPVVNNYDVTINTVTGNGQEIGAAFVRYVKDYERVNGIGWRTGS